MHLESFLKLVLPTEGYKCWVDIRNKVVIQGFVPTAEELAVKLREIDARGHDAYFACATYVTDRNRRAGNAGWMKSFWLDIDAGEGKPYATVEDAIQACDEFCARVSLPVPGIVRSGYGAHAYWPLTATLPNPEWVCVAQRLKLLAAAHGFHADPARTSDAASILRAPGTKNYKAAGDPRLVTIDDIELFEEVENETFIAAVTTAVIPAGVLLTNQQSATSPGSADAKTNASLTAGISRAFDPAKGLAEGGRNNACATYAGELTAKGHSQDEVLKLCLEWNQRNTPPMPDREVHTTVASITRKHLENHPPIAIPTEVAALPALPFGYFWGPQQQLMVKIKVDKDDGTFEWDLKMISQRPVYLAAIMNSEGGAQCNSYLFHQYHSTKGWQQFAMNAKELNGPGWYGDWFQNGGELMTGADKYFKNYVREASNMLRIPGNEQTRYSQFGWKDDDKAFLVGEHLCKANGDVERAYGTDKLSPLMRTMVQAKGGSLEAWSSAANKLFTPGMEAHGFMLLASFAAPLMKFCVDEGNGGAMLSVVSEESGHGKTPMATAMASVWGEPASTIVTGNFTENRRIEELVRHCHLPQVQEEMAYGDPLIAAEGVEKFTSGTDRGRLDRSGASQGLPERYQTIVVSLSNKSLFELVRMANVPMSRRIFEIEVERPDEKILSNIGGISRDMMRNCGFAGLQFVRLLVNEQIHKYVSEHLRGHDGKPGSVVMKYRDKLQTRPEHRFIVWLLSSIEVAAHILVHYGILQFNVERIMTWAQLQAGEKILHPDMDETPMKLHRFLSENIDYCLTVQGPYTPKGGPQIPARVPKGRIYMRMELKTDRLYIANDAIQSWCLKNNVSFINMGKRLTELGVITERSRPITLGAGTDIPTARTLCWEIDMTHPQISGQIRLEMEKEPQKIPVAQ